MIDDQHLHEQDAALDAPPVVSPEVVETTPAEVAGLLDAARLSPVVPSPLVDQPAADPGPETRRALVDAGWMTGGDQPELTNHGRTVLSLLESPARRVDLVLGTASWWFTWTGLSGADRDGPVLTVATSPDGQITLSYPYPPAAGIDLLRGHLLVGAVPAAVPWEVELSDRAFVTWSGLLDDRAEANLRAVLDRTPVTRSATAVDDVLNALAEGRTSGHLAWQTPVTSMLWSDVDSALGGAAVRQGLDELAASGVVELSADGTAELTDGGRLLVDSLVPVARWAGILHTERDPMTGALTTERLAVRRGVGATVVESRPLGGTTTKLRSVDDAELEMLTTTLHAAVRAGEPAVVPALCSSCRAILHDGAHFCHECGAPTEGDGGSS